MEKYNLKEDIKVFGTPVKTFPVGIDAAFDELIKKTGDSAEERNYYGVSTMRNGIVLYNAMAEEKYEGEAAKYNCEKYLIEKGEYLITTVKDWKQKTHTIKDVFSDIVQHANADTAKPAIEWYKNEREMLCMLKVKLSQ